MTLRRGKLFEPPKDGEAPAWWLRGLLILTCTSVSFSHGTNDGQKSIGLIMLTIIGLMPATYALNPVASAQWRAVRADAAASMPLIRQYGDATQSTALQAAAALQAAPDAASAATPAQLRGDVYFVLAALKHVDETPNASQDARAQAAKLRQAMGPPVHYAPIWVRMLSALCLGIGTMVGYKRVVRTLGERLGKSHMTPGQGASAELVGSVLIGTAGLTGLPVSTTHIITSGIAGTMVAGGQGVQRGMLVRIALAWLLTLPATILIAGGVFYVLDNPRF